MGPSIDLDEAEKYAMIFKALSDPTRITILNILRNHGGEVCVFELTENFKKEQPTISHHLRILRDAGLVRLRKSGLYAYYYVLDDKLKEASEAALSMCGGNQVTEFDSCRGRHALVTKREIISKG